MFDCFASWNSVFSDEASATFLMFLSPFSWVVYCQVLLNICEYNFCCCVQEYSGDEDGDDFTPDVDDSGLMLGDESRYIAKDSYPPESYFTAVQDLYRSW